ncbi:hypothetical protein KSW81_003623 [Nannochloris sp. 'desiccata']|nr:hypothetical protein KSW81_003623 [Chlorella desiccata (nom. nud.)]
MMARPLQLACCFALLLTLAYSPTSYAQDYSDYDCDDYDTSDGCSSNYYCDSGTCVNNDDDYCDDYDTSDGCSSNYVCESGTCVNNDDDYCDDYDTSDGCSSNYVCESGTCVNKDDDYCDDYDTSDGCSSNYVCESGTCVNNDDDYCDDYDTSDGCSSNYVCESGTCVNNDDDYCDDYDTSDGCSSNYVCESGTCEAIPAPKPSPPSPTPSPRPPPISFSPPIAIDPSPPLPVEYPKPDSFAEISFNVAGATRDTFDPPAFATMLSDFTGIPDDWIEVNISEENTDIVARRRNFQRRRHLLRSLLQDTGTSGLIVDTKLYTEQIQETVDKVKTAVGTGQAQQKLAETNDKISGVVIIAESDSSSSSNVGAIVGGVIGGIAAVGLAAGGFAFWHTRSKKKVIIYAGTVQSGEAPVISQQEQRNQSGCIGLNPPDTIPSNNTTSSSLARTISSKRSSGFSFQNLQPPPTLPPGLPVDPLMGWVSEQLASNPPIRPNLLNGPYEVQFAQLQVDRPIGEGSFGRVYAGKLNNDAVAIKVLLEASSGRVNDPLLANSALTASSPIMMKLHEEVKIMSSMDSPHVVKFIGVCSMPPCIVTELCAEGSLSDVIKNAASSPAAASQLTWRRRLAMAIDAAEGMRYLHSQTPPIIHRDLKSANMLVTGDFRVKISDFNLSKILDDSTKSSSLAAMNPRWLAPELFAGARGSPPCDVFAFGVVLWELLTLDVPWGNTNPWQIVSTIQRGGRLPIPERGQLQAAAPMTAACYAGYVRLIAKCWAQMPEERPEFGRVSEELRILAAGNV